MRLLKVYGRVVAHHPVIVLLLMLLVSAYAVEAASNIKNAATSYRKMLPEETDIVRTMLIAGDQFGGISSALIVIESAPSESGSNEIRDMRDPEAVKYVGMLAKRALLVHDVIGASSAADVVRENGMVPGDIEVIKGYAPGLSRYISDDHSMSLVRLQLSPDFDEQEIALELEAVAAEVPRPAGVLVSVSGEAVQSGQMEKLIGPDMQKTSAISLAGILIIVVLLFSSLRYGLIPMTTIIFGTLWAFGIMGLLGMTVDSQMAGVTSMIMGIGIDFGIQVVTRFRHELGNKGSPEEAIAVTLENVILPMGISTLAALVGFKAMALGTLTFLGSLGVVMAYGVAASMVAAITVVPALLVISERYLGKEVLE